jgi:hypothetical protein
VAYLEDNAKDFIQFKASLLMNEEWPYKKGWFDSGYGS